MIAAKFPGVQEYDEGLDETNFTESPLNSTVDFKESLAAFVCIRKIKPASNLQIFLTLQYSLLIKL